MEEKNNDIEFKLKKKTWKELSFGKKSFFITCLLVMIGTLVYTGLNLDGLNVRYDTINNYVTGCEMTFRNGRFDSVDCPNEKDKLLINISGELTQEYTLNDYYNTVKDNPFYNLTFGD